MQSRCGIRQQNYLTSNPSNEISILKTFEKKIFLASVLCYENIDLVVLFMITFNYKFDCSFCWYWWNWSTSLFKIFFFINHLLSIYKPGSWCFWPRNLCSNEQHKFLSISVSLRLLTFRLFQPWFPKDLLTHLIFPEIKTLKL
jgi:hypothetical protein